MKFKLGRHSVTKVFLAQTDNRVKSYLLATILLIVSSWNLSAFTPLDYSFMVTHVINSNDGAIQVTPLNGSGSYTVQWLDSNYNNIGNNLVLSGLSEGVYFLILTDNNDPTKEVNTYFWVGKYGATTTLSVQPDGRFGVDAEVKYAANPTYASVNTRNFGTTNDLGIYTGTNSNQINYGRAFIAFQYNGLFSATIEDAKFSIHGRMHRNQPQTNQTIQNEVYLRRVTQAWSEDQITWTNQVGSTSVNEVIIAAAGANNSFIITQDYVREIIVTNHLKAHVEQNMDNHGFLLGLVEEGTYRTQIFRSSDFSDPLKRPALTITFTVPALPPFMQTKASIDGSYLKLAEDRILRFSYAEAYNDQDNELTYKIYNEQHKVVMTEANEALSSRFGDNRLVLDVDCCLDCNHFYILELTNEKNEKQYLRFRTAPWPDDGSGAVPVGHPCFSNGGGGIE